MTQVKQFQIRGENYPYISAQAWRKWLRNTVSFLSDQILYTDRLNKKIADKDKKHIEGITHYAGNPVLYIEDEIFGFSNPQLYIPEQIEGELYNVVSTNRQTVLNTSSIMPLLSDSMINTIEGYVHLDVDTPLPYKNEFMNGYFNAVTSLDIDRIGIYKNIMDIYELDPSLAKLFLDDKYITVNEVEGGEIYQINNFEDRKKYIIKLYFDLLLSLYPDVKSSQFAVDASPKIFVSAVLKSSANIFSDLVDIDDNYPYFNIDKLISIVSKRGHQLLTDIYIGYRSGTFNEKNEYNLLKLNNMELKHRNGFVNVYVMSPGEVKNKIIDELGGLMK